MIAGDLENYGKAAAEHVERIFEARKTVAANEVPWLARTATFRPPLNAGSMALGSTSCRGQRHIVGTGGKRGTEQRGERKV